MFYTQFLVTPFNVSIYTGDLAKAGGDSNVTLKFFGSKGTSSDIFIEKMENRFERASIDDLPVIFFKFITLKPLNI